MTLFEHCDYYVDLVLYPCQADKVREDIYNLCIEYLINDHPRQSTVEKLKEFFKLN